MRKSSIHIGKGKFGFLRHNSRERPTRNRIFNVEIEIDRNFDEAVALFRKEIKKRKKKYEERMGRKLPKNTVLHLSAIINLDERHTLEDVRKVAYVLEKTLGTKVFQMAVHKDEGWIDENGKKHVNYHAHIEFLGLDEEGRSVRRKLTKKYLSSLQTVVSKVLNMPRGRNYIAERAPRPRRLDTYAYKRFAEERYKHFKELKNAFRRKFRELKKQLEKETETEKEQLANTLKEAKELLSEAQELLEKWKQKDEKMERYAKALGEIEARAEERWRIKL